MVGSVNMVFSVRMATGLVAMTWLLGCGDPLDGVAKLSDVELAETPPVAAIAPEGQSEETPVAEPGLLGRMIGGGADPADAETSSDAAEPDAVEAVAANTAAPRRGLFGGGASRPSAKAKPPSVPPGTILSFGLVKPVCDLPKSKRGKEIEAFPARSKAYRLYDSEPGRTTAHPFYVTGFDDGCARTFTAALAVFGAPEMHELLRYGLPADIQPYSATDSAYEKIKSRICRVGRGKPCGSKVSRIEKNTVFVSAYEKYGDNARWFNMLLHDGEVAETDLKSGG
ncbi:hypothetical protein Q4577_06365 [Marinovum sp. 2_MG-2023]|uniref:hypothetical protein n=1 Tax=unclassified Marinovum TaxID=2647166 RepID=UPI0026E1F3FD|nr:MULTISPECIES: hypothetical protein [unclassified Marinovum]MDO6729633.1 hypothetical protein [Marinovum sp. 2_MG-2023]MDO6779447.1 hypothetical protein [Marinovum sp. 1_MG-2023]